MSINATLKGVKVEVRGSSKPDKGVFGVRRGWLIILAFVLQLFAILFIADPSALAVKRAIIGITAVMIAAGILPNLRWWAFRIFALGFILNTLVMAANGGLMPVTPENHQSISGAEGRELTPGQSPRHSKNVLLDSSDTNLGFLSDRILISIPRSKIYSLGDLFLIAGLAVFVVETSVRAWGSRASARPIHSTVAPTHGS